MKKTIIALLLLSLSIFLSASSMYENNSGIEETRFSLMMLEKAVRHFLSRSFESAVSERKTDSIKNEGGVDRRHSDAFVFSSEDLTLGSGGRVEGRKNIGTSAFAFIAEDDEITVTYSGEAVSHLTIDRILNDCALSLSPAFSLSWKTDGDGIVIISFSSLYSSRKYSSLLLLEKLEEAALNALTAEETDGYTKEDAVVCNDGVEVIHKEGEEKTEFAQFSFEALLGLRGKFRYYRGEDHLYPSFSLRMRETLGGIVYIESGLDCFSYIKSSVFYGAGAVFISGGINILLWNFDIDVYGGMRFQMASKSSSFSSGPGFTFGAGIGYRIMEKLIVRAQYEYLNRNHMFFLGTAVRL